MKTVRKILVGVCLFFFTMILMVFAVVGLAYKSIDHQMLEIDPELQEFESQHLFIDPEKVPREESTLSGTFCLVGLELKPCNEQPKDTLK